MTFSMDYYELYGLPGCGKTTVSRLLVKQLREEGYKVADFNDVFLKYNHGYPRKWEFFKLLFQIKEFPLFYYYWRLYKECDCKSKRRLSNLMILTHRIICTYKSHEYDILFLEEGVIQFISSLVYLGTIRDDERICKIVDILNKIIKIQPIYCCLDVELSLERIKGRERAGDRFSKSTDADVMYQALNYKKANLDNIASSFLYKMKIDMTERIDNNVKILESKLLNK